MSLEAWGQMGQGCQQQGRCWRTEPRQMHPTLETGNGNPQKTPSWQGETLIQCFELRYEIPAGG